MLPCAAICQPDQIFDANLGAKAFSVVLMAENASPNLPKPAPTHSPTKLPQQSRCPMGTPRRGKQKGEKPAATPVTSKYKKQHPRG